MTPADPNTRRDLEIAADPVFQFRAREKTTQPSVYTVRWQEYDPAYPLPPLQSSDIDAARVTHRPTERTHMVREARRLVALGLTPRDVADALELTECAVVGLLRDRPDAR